MKHFENIPDIIPVQIADSMVISPETRLRVSGSLPSIPHFSRFNRYYLHFARFVLDFFHVKNPEAELNFSYETESEASLLSVSLTVSRKTEQRTTPLFLNGKLWDLASGFPRSLRSVYPCSKKELLRTLLESAALEEQHYRICCYPDSEPRIRTFLESQQLILKGGRFAVLFQPGTIAPVSEGIPQLLLPAKN